MSGWKRCNSNKGTGGMECSVVLFKPRINMFACTHPSVSNSLDCNDWLAYKHQSTACVQTRLDYGSLLSSSISFHPVFQKPCVSNTFELWILVCVHASVSSLVKPVWMGIPCLSISISLQLCQTPVQCSNSFGLWLLVLVHASVNSLLFQTRFFFVFFVCLPSRPHQNESLRFVVFVFTKFASSNFLYARARSHL